MQLRALASYVEGAREQEGRYPQTLDNLAQDVNNSDWTPRVAVDPWGSVIQYRVLGPNSFTLSSFGPDRKPDTSDDIHLDVVDGRLGVREN